MQRFTMIGGRKSESQQALEVQRIAFLTSAGVEGAKVLSSGGLVDEGK